MFALFIAHHALNFRWYKAALRGRYTPYRVFQLAVNVLLLAAMLFLMASGIMLSNHVFDFLGIGFGASLRAADAPGGLALGLRAHGAAPRYALGAR